MNHPSPYQNSNPLPYPGGEYNQPQISQNNYQHVPNPAQCSPQYPPQYPPQYSPQYPPQYPPQIGYDPNLTDIPGYKLISRGSGIDNKEYYVITHSAADALNAKEDPLSNGVVKRIKSQIGGEWMVFASVEGLKGYDFSLSIVTGNDFLSFLIKNFRFQVCRLRD